MPLGIQRLNARPSSHPTPHIGFIKALPGPGSAHAEALLQRIAAICHPILAAHHLAVMTLEEYEPNREFLGRNFNAGEVIQLVLRRRRTPSREHARTGVHTGGSAAPAPSEPQWLPFRSLVLVMLHELAHCVHMHHRAAFWQVREQYTAEMRALWARRYTGEGLWGQGRALGSAEELEGPRVGLEDGMPAEICGGVYRRRRKPGRKRKRAGADGAGELDRENTPTYAERQQRRIRRKFGAGGTLLGDDDLARKALEYSNSKTKGVGRPRVAQSARGRELRAQAALVRLGQSQQQQADSNPTNSSVSKQTHLPFTKVEPDLQTKPRIIDDHSTDLDSATDSDDGDESMTPFSDNREDVVRVCPSTDPRDSAGEEWEHVKTERQELYNLYAVPPAAAESPSHASARPPQSSHEPRPELPKPATATPRLSKSSPVPRDKTGQEPPTEAIGAATGLICPACSLHNSHLLACCTACGCVLWPERTPGSWRCASEVCRDNSVFVNSGDYGVCAVCGERQP